jgi:MFS family permease
MENNWYIKMLSALYLSTFIIRLCFGVILLVLPYYLKHAVSDFMFGIIWSASPFAEMFSVMLIGIAVDKFGRKKVLLLGLITGAISLFLYGLTRNAYMLIVINAFHGIAAASILVSSLALVADYAGANSRGREMGAFDFANLFGWFSGFLIGGVLVSAYEQNLSIPFFIAGILALIACGYAYFLIREPYLHKFIAREITPRHIISVISSKQILLLVLPWLMLYIIIGVILSFFSMESAKIAMPATHLALVLGGGGTVFLLTQVFYGKLSDRYGRMPVLITGTTGILVLIGTIVFAILSSPEKNVAGLISVITGNYAILAIAGVSALLAGAFGPSALASLADECPEKGKGLTMALYSIVISAGMTIGPPCAGYINEHAGNSAVFMFMFLCAGLMVLFVVMRYLDLRRGRKN